MRLFLSSHDFGRYPEVLVELVGNNVDAVFINNAKDFETYDDRQTSSEEKKHEFRQLGFKVQELDLRNYFKEPKKLASDLQDMGLIWVSGGNTFMLRRAMAYSGFDKSVKDLLENDKVVYGGSSAGSIVATPSLRGTEYGDDPKIVPTGYKKPIIWDGLGLVPFHIVPHYQSDWFGHEAEKMIAFMQKHKMPYKPLKDGQVIVVEGKKKEFFK